MLEVGAWTDKATCPRCNCMNSNLHQNHSYWVRDLPISNRQFGLIVNRRQFKDKAGKKPFSKDLDFVDRRCKYTNRLALEIVQQVKNSNVHSVVQNNELTNEEVWSMVKHSANPHS